MQWMWKRQLKLGVVALCILVSAMGSADAGQGEGPAEGWESFRKLQEGNRRYVSDETTYELDVKRRQELAGGQHPHSIVLSCSDSRVPPELVFDQGLGDVFAVRVAGNVVDDHAIASIEYAVEHLEVPLIVIMGHESCGAVKAALSTPRGKSLGTPSLDALIGTIQDNLGGNQLFSAKDKTLAEPVRTNVSVVAEQLVRRSHVIQEYLEKGKLLIAQGIYSLESGEVTYWYVGQPLMNTTVEAKKAPPSDPGKKSARPSNKSGSGSSQSSHSATPAHH